MDASALSTTDSYEERIDTEGLLRTPFTTCGNHMRYKRLELSVEAGAGGTEQASRRPGVHLRYKTARIRTLRRPFTHRRRPAIQ